MKEGFLSGGRRREESRGGFEEGMDQRSRIMMENARYRVRNMERIVDGKEERGGESCEGKRDRARLELDD